MERDVSDPFAKTVTFSREEALAVEAALERRIERLRERVTSGPHYVFTPLTDAQAALAKLRTA